MLARGDRRLAPVLLDMPRAQLRGFPRCAGQPRPTAADVHRRASAGHSCPGDVSSAASAELLPHEQRSPSPRWVTLPPGAVTLRACGVCAGAQAGTCTLSIMRGLHLDRHQPNGLAYYTFAFAGRLSPSSSMRSPPGTAASSAAPYAEPEPDTRAPATIHWPWRRTSAASAAALGLRARARGQPQPAPHGQCAPGGEGDRGQRLRRLRCPDHRPAGRAAPAALRRLHAGACSTTRRTALGGDPQRLARHRPGARPCRSRGAEPGVRQPARPSWSAAIGPSIGPCCYEVGDEVVDCRAGGVRPARRRCCPRNRAGRRHFDLWAANRRWLAEAGVRQIETAELCTACHTDEFYSYRAETGKTGHFGAMMALPVIGSDRGRRERRT